MLLTDAFVYIHQPKTGGTFVAATLLALHQARGDRVDTVWWDSRSGLPPPDVAPGRVVRLMLADRQQHGARADIPAPYRDRPVLATIRNPYDRYVSQFEFAWWRRLPEMFGPVETVQQRFPAYPTLTFPEFLALSNDVSVPFRAPRHPADTPGFHTQQFVEFFFRHPKDVYPRLLDAHEADALRSEAHENIRYLNQARLNDELGAWLANMGYSAEEVQRVRAADHIWPPEGGRAKDADWQAYYTAPDKALVRQKERWLFDWFPEFDV